MVPIVLVVMLRPLCALLAPIALLVRPRLYPVQLASTAKEAASTSSNAKMVPIVHLVAHTQLRAQEAASALEIHRMWTLRAAAFLAEEEHTQRLLTTSSALTACQATCAWGGRTHKHQRVGRCTEAIGAQRVTTVLQHPMQRLLVLKAHTRRMLVLLAPLLASDARSAGTVTWRHKLVARSAVPQPARLLQEEQLLAPVSVLTGGSSSRAAAVFVKQDTSPRTEETQQLTQPVIASSS
jgi:hypothetical protein